jgi:hypothetical protein
MSTRWKDIKYIYIFHDGGLHRFYFKGSLKRPRIGSAPKQRNWRTNWQQSSQIHISQTIQPKLANKYSLQRYWKYLQLSFQNPTQIRHVRSLKMTLNMYCTNWSKKQSTRTGQQSSEGHNSSSTQLTNAYDDSMESQETYYKIFLVLKTDLTSN